MTATVTPTKETIEHQQFLGAVDELAQIAHTMNVLDSIQIYEHDEQALRCIVSMVRERINESLARVRGAGIIDSVEEEA
jgi:hypothetical protein